MYFAYYNNIPIGEIINLYTIDPLDKWLGNSNNDQWISQPFSAAINSPVPAVFRNHHVMCLLWLSSHGRAYYQIRQKTPWQPKTHQTILSYLHQQTCTVPLALSQGWSFLPGLWHCFFSTWHCQPCPITEVLHIHAWRSSWGSFPAFLVWRWVTS